MFQVRRDQRAALETFVVEFVLSEAPESGRVLGGAWLDRVMRGGKSRQIAGWEPEELDQHDAAAAFVSVVLEVIDAPGNYSLRVEWRAVDDAGKPDTQANVFRRKKRFQVKRELVPKADRTNDSGAAIRGLGASIASTSDRAMDAASRHADQAVRIQSAAFDRMIAIQERHADRLDQEQASIVDLLHQNGELQAELAVSDIRLELVGLQAGNDLTREMIGGAIQVLAPLVGMLSQRFLGPPAPGALQGPATERDRQTRIQEIAALQAALAAELEQLEAEDHEANSSPGPIAEPVETNPTRP